MVVNTIEDLDAVTAAWRKAGETIALVPTMGSLHEGHLALVDRAREIADHVVVSIFVNPLQFGPGEDFETYPRQLDKDRELLAGTGAEILFAPSVHTIYPDGATAPTVLAAGDVGGMFEGSTRPGHFDGVVTVVKRLFDVVKPDSAVFGKKDAQQLFLIREMVREEKLPVMIHDVETVRAVDGLALSSRNVYLNPAERTVALSLSKALQAAKRTSSIPEALQMARHVLDREDDLVVDYLEVVDPANFHPITSGPRGVMIVAARVGSTRLIDNQELLFHQ